MAVAEIDKPSLMEPLREDPPRAKKWTGEEYDRLVALGIFDHERVQLIDGEIFDMSPMNEPHAQAIKLANFAMLRIFPVDRYTVQIQCPMRLGESSRPEPDLAVVAGDPRRQTTHPSNALLIIEVSDSTLEFDRKEKASLYARSGIPEYWILNLAGRCLEVHRAAIGDPTDPRYAEVRVVGASESIAPLSAPGLNISVSDLLP